MAASDFLKTESNKALIIINLLFLVAYFGIISFTFLVSSWWLFLVLMVGQCVLFFDRSHLLVHRLGHARTHTAF